MEPDEAIVRRVLDGDQRAFEVLVLRYQDTVARFIWNIVPSHHDREEVCQDVFVKVFFNLDRFRFDARFSTWLYQIAYRSAISFRRRSRPDTVDIEDVDPPGQADTSVEDAETRKLLDGVLNDLKLEERTVVTLYYQQELTVDEIGKVIDRPAGTVKSILYRVRQKLEGTISRRMPDLLEAI